MNTTIADRNNGEASRRITANLAQPAMNGSAAENNQTDGRVDFLTGGIGLRHAIVMKQAMHRFPLSLEFHTKANGKRRFLAGVPISIRDTTGKVVLETRSAGPFLLARLKSGHYEVMAGPRNRMQRRHVYLPAHSNERVVFEWGA